MNPQPNSPERSTTPDPTNVSFPPPCGLSPAEPGPSSQPSAKAGSSAGKRPSAKKAAVIARVRERLTGPPSLADGTVPTKELEMENRLRARVLAGSDTGAARLTRDTAVTIKRTWNDFGGALLAYPRDTPPEERRPLPAKPDDSETSTDD